MAWKSERCKSRKKNKSLYGRSQSIHFYDDIDTQSCEKWDEEWEMKQDIQSQWDQIHQAIRQNNVGQLNDLLPPINLYNSKEKYWSNNFYRWKYISGEDILLKAINLQHSDCIDVILNKIYYEDLPPNIVNYIHPRNGQSPLAIACERNDMNLVRKLVERGHASAALCKAFFIAFEGGNEALMNYLAARCDVRQEDHLGRTALDCVINAGYMDTAKTLICHGEIGRNRDGFSALMLVAHHNLSLLVDLLFERLPLQEAVDELVLLACHYTITGDVQNRQKAFDFFVQGVNKEESREPTILHKAAECRQECQTLDQLLAIRDDDNAMRTHALLASERILLRLGDVDLLLKFIYRQCNVYRRNHLFYRSLQLRIHAHQIAVSTQIDYDVLFNWHRSHFHELITDLSGTCNETGIVPIYSIEIVTAWLLDEGMYHNIWRIFEFLATIVNMFKTVKMNNYERRSLLANARRIVQNKTMKYSFLIYYIRVYANNSSVHELPIFNVSTLSVIHLLILCGANVNEIDTDWSFTRPLHMIARCSNIDIAKPIIQLLHAQGAHADCIDSRGNLPEDLALEPTVKEFLRSNRNLSLRCRCAQIIVSKRTNYQKYLSSNLITFVRLHNNKLYN
ncbi:hypothetical protein I4U23_022811 [Adineta vaga]|nr:hypothetical protein I4U23_022811 [Adineta vaga]